MIAVSLKDSDELVELLLKKGADVNAKSLFFLWFFHYILTDHPTRFSRTSTYHAPSSPISL